jgi:branched-chain amino acid transport system substrate-binding protein
MGDGRTDPGDATRSTTSEKLTDHSLSRRRFIQVAGVSAGALSFGGLLSACKSSSTGGTGGSGAAGQTLKIGYVSPKTGSLAPFGAADDFIIGGIQSALSGGISVGGTKYNVQILEKDTQSDPNRAAQVASDLITSDGVNLMLVASTPETTNPVSDQCEANGVPCISTVAPWQPWFLGRQADPANPKPFKYTYHFFWGLEDIIAVFASMWNSMDTNKTVAGLFPNDGDGNAWGDPKLGFPTPLKAQGYSMIDPGRYQDGTQDFTAQISQYKSKNAQILTGVPIPPDFTNFWKQATQQGFVPKIASVGKALLFPSSVEALGALGEGLSCEVWWTPNHPFSSSLTGDSSKKLADAYTASTSKQWTQPIGFVHALFEVAADVLKRSASLEPTAVVDSIKATNLNTIVGNIQWTGQPFPNVAKTKLCGGQWRKGTTFPYDLNVVENTAIPDVPLQGSLVPITAS